MTSKNQSVELESSDTPSNVPVQVSVPSETVATSVDPPRTSEVPGTAAGARNREEETSDDSSWNPSGSSVVSDEGVTTDDSEGRDEVTKLLKDQK